MLIERQQTILELARQHGRVTVEQLAEAFEVSPQTIRKDLNELCGQRLLFRVHGGAMIAPSRENMGYEARRTLARDEKKAIGARAAALIPDSASLFINIGTTTEAVADELVRHTGLMVITNNINVANSLRVYPGMEVVVAGGVVRRADGGIVGEAAVDFIRQFKVDYAVIGVSAIDMDGALLDYDFREVKVAQAIIANARHVILVADSSKLERRAPVRIGHISQVHSFVTDRCADENLRRICAESEVDLIEAVPQGKAS